MDEISLWPRAGHFRYFLIFSIIKNDFFAFFIKFIPISSPVLFKNRTPSQINLIKKCKKSFFVIEIAAMASFILKSNQQPNQILLYSHRVFLHAESCEEGSVVIEKIKKIPPISAHVVKYTQKKNHVSLVHHLNEASRRVSALFWLKARRTGSQLALNLGAAVAEASRGFRSQRSSAAMDRLKPCQASPSNQEKVRAEGKEAVSSGQGFLLSSGQNLNLIHFRYF